MSEDIDLHAVEGAARALVLRGEARTARPLLEFLVERAPDLAWPSAELGFLLAHDGEVVLAGKRFAEALNRGSRDARAALGLAWCALATGQPALAEDMARRVLSADPANLAALRSVAQAQLAQNRAGEALRTLEGLQESPEDRLLLGRTLQALGRLDEALTHFLSVLGEGEAQHAPEARLLAITVLQAQVRHQEALALCEAGLAESPTEARLQYLAAFSRLTLGDLTGGFRDFESRYRISDAYRPPQSFPGPPPSVEAVAGRTVVVYCEQGLGDTLQFCRFVKPLADLGAEVRIVTRPPLARLLAGLGGASGVSLFSDPRPRADFGLSFISLPAFLEGRTPLPPPFSAYLSADPDEAEQWRARLGARRRQSRLGLVWSGGLRSERADSVEVNARRNIPLGALEPLLNLDDVEWTGLQKGEPGESEHAALKASGAPFEFVNFGPELSDLAQTAALLANLDGVVTVDTAVAHLAGAMGLKVMLLNRFDTCWRWMLGRADTPWYPSMRLIRQDTPDDWDGAVQRAVSALPAFFV